MESQKVSIIIPVYRAEKYLRQCVQSILSQSHSCLEVILVDDGSPDGSGAICDWYVAEDKRVKVVHKENAGVSSARNAGLDVATGDYIAFVDSDDTISADFIEKLLAGVEQAAADVCCCGYTYISKEEKYTHTDYPVISEPDRSYFIDCLFRGTGGTVCSKLYRREIVEQWNIRFNEKFSLCEDQLFALEYYSVAKRFAVVDGYGYYYNKLDSGIVSSAGTERWYQQLELMDLMEDQMRKIQISPDLIDSCIERKCKNVICALIRKTLSQGRAGVKAVLSDDAIMRRLRTLRVRGKGDVRYILPLKLRCFALIRVAYKV